MGRKKDRRGGGDRRKQQIPVAVERRSGQDRRSGIDRRVNANVSVSDQIHAALDLVTRATELDLLGTQERALLKMAVHRLEAALRQMEEQV